MNNEPPASRAAAAWNAPDAVAARRAEWLRMANVMPARGSEETLSETLQRALHKSKASAPVSPAAAPKVATIYDLAKHQDAASYINARRQQVKAA